MTKQTAGIQRDCFAIARNDRYTGVIARNEVTKQTAGIQRDCPTQLRWCARRLATTEENTPYLLYEREIRYV